MKRFEDPIVLDDGTTLTTLREAIAYLAKTVAKAEHNHPAVLNASDHLTRSAEQGPSDCSPLSSTSRSPRHGERGMRDFMLL